MKLDNHTKIKIENFNKPLKMNWQLKYLKKFITPTTTVLDIGCAAGNLSKLLENKHNYTGVEYNEDLIKFAKSNNLNVHFCDLTTGRLPFKDRTFDIVWFRHVIEHLNTREQVLIMKEIYRVLRGYGVVFVIGPTPYNWFFWDNCTHVRPCTHGQLEALAKDCGFTKATACYSLTRKFGHGLQKWLRLTPLRWFMWETYMIASK